VIPVGDQDGFAAGQMYSLSLVLSRTDLMSTALEPSLELGSSPFLSGRFSKAIARVATVLVDEVGANGGLGNRSDRPTGHARPRR
jgi:hypothetical protein